MSDADRSRETPDVPEGSLIIQPGARIGSLRLIKELGLGGQGVVYHAVREADGLELAAKILRTDISLTDDLIDRFEREAEAAGRLHHENIVAAYGIEEVGELRIILQEMATGGNLDDVIRERAAAGATTTLEDCRWAADLCRRLALALAHAHDLKVVHRDMKPGNVLLSADGVPKITDFGLAKVEDLFGLTQTGDRMGTPSYMSPEQVEAHRDGVDSRTDIYSLGAMLYRMVARQVPFAAENLSALFRDIMARAPVPPRKLQPAVPRDLQAVILKALQKAPADRYQKAEDFAADLQRFLDGKPTVARPEGLVVRTMRSMSHLTVSTLCVVAVLIPTAWFAIDLLVRQGTDGNIRLHDVRYGLVALSALALSWPLSILGLRLTRGRAWTIAAAAGLSLLLGGGAGAVVREQKTTQLHRADLTLLSQALDFEERGDRRDVEDLVAYASAWESRFDDEDDLLLGRAFLKRLRPLQADRWARTLEAAHADSPPSLALVLAVADALGDEERANAADLALWQLSTADVGWQAWRQAGDVLRDVERYAEAMRAYAAAGKQPDSEAGRDQLNLKLAQVAVGLCDWKEAEYRLKTYIEWKPQDPAANRVGCKVARNALLDISDDRDQEQAQLAVIEKYLAVLEQGGAETRVVWLDQRYALLTERNESDAAWQVVVAASETPNADPTVLDWCATRAIGEQQFEFARDVWESMAKRHPDLAVPFIGLTNAYYQLARLEDTDEGRAALYRQSVASGRRAMELDPFYYQTYWNTFLPLWKTRQAERQAESGPEAGLTQEDWQELLDLVDRSLRYNGLQPETLNAGAFINVRLYEHDQDSAHLAQATQLIRRAIRQTERRLQSPCGSAKEDRGNLSDYYDTLRDLQEREGNQSAALATARTALAVLLPEDDDVGKRTDEVTRLEGLLPSGR